MTEITPLILAIPSTDVDPQLELLIKRLNPAGFILMGRNCQDIRQVKELVTKLKSLCRHPNPLILIDQEGGRVTRLKFSVYKAPAGKIFGDIYKTDPAAAIEAARLSAFITAAELAELGINSNTLPLADVLSPVTHGIIGDRAFSDDPQAVATLCGATISGCLAGGVWPVIKHAPGHGCAATDSHLELPLVADTAHTLRCRDFIPFKVNAACPLVMTAHVLYSALDDKNPASQSPAIHNILRNQLGMNGLIMCDDLGMRALHGTFEARLQKALDAGADFALACFTNPANGQWQEGGLQELSSIAGKFQMTEQAVKKLANLPPLPEPDLGAVADATQKLAKILHP